jgi:hypothetical protein
VTLTVIHITAKGLHPFTDTEVRHLGQYELLAESLRSQTYTDFEVVCVDAYATLPRPELTWWLRDRARFVRPRETPWTRIGAFCASSARNCGLAWARGEVVVSLDDCYSLPPYFLERVAGLAAQGRYAWPYVRTGDDVPGAYAVEGPQDLLPDEYSGGIVVYPLAAALACNGWPEWDGVRQLEDWAFSAHLKRRSVRQVRDASVYVVDPGRPQHVVGQGARWRVHRCPRALWALAAGRNWQRANEPLTAAELAQLEPCVWRKGGTCTYVGLPSQAGGICEYPTTPTDDALRVMREYESLPWFDLLAERRRNGVE